MKRKTIIVNIILSAIIHIALLSVMLSFRGHKHLPQSDTNVLIATLVRPQAKQIPQTTNAPQTPPQQKKQNSHTTQTTPNNTEQTIHAEENTEYAITEISGNNELITSENHDNSYTENLITTENHTTNSPKPLYMPKIPYPRAAKTAKIEGIAEISYTIDTTGRVSDVRLLSAPHVSFEKIIEKSVLTWRFAPATKNGKPIAITANQTILFKLE